MIEYGGNMTGQITRISTMADGSIRIVVDVQPEQIPDNLLRQIGQMVEVEVKT